MEKEELFSLNFVAIQSLWILKTRLSRLLYRIGLPYEIMHNFVNWRLALYL